METRNKIPAGRRCINLRPDYATVIARPGCLPFVFTVEKCNGKLRLIMKAGDETIKHFPLTDAQESA
jgi:hypothetical protein